MQFKVIWSSKFLLSLKFMLIFFFFIADDGCTMVLTSWFRYKRSEFEAGQDFSAPSYGLIEVVVCTLFGVMIWIQEIKVWGGQDSAPSYPLWSWRSCCAEYSWTHVQLKLDCLGSEAISMYLLWSWRSCCVMCLSIYT